MSSHESGCQIRRPRAAAAVRGVEPGVAELGSEGGDVLLPRSRLHPIDARAELLVKGIGSAVKFRRSLQVTVATSQQREAKLPVGEHHEITVAPRDVHELLEQPARLIVRAVEIRGEGEVANAQGKATLV